MAPRPPRHWCPLFDMADVKKRRIEDDEAMDEEPSGGLASSPPMAPPPVDLVQQEFSEELLRMCVPTAALLPKAWMITHTSAPAAGTTTGYSRST